MSDYQIVQYQDFAPLESIGLFDSNPLTLDIRGRDFESVSEVRINDITSPEFITLSPQRVLAQVPVSQLSSRIRSVQVLLSRNGITGTSLLRLRAVVPGARATGFTRLVQTFIRILLTNPGEDLNNEALGGGLRVGVGSAGDQAQLRVLAARAVTDTEAQLIQLQATNASLDDSERLRSATLVSANYVASSTSLNLQIRLTAMDGSTGTPTVSV